MGGISCTLAPTSVRRVANSGYQRPRLPFLHRHTSSCILRGPESTGVRSSCYWVLSFHCSLCNLTFLRTAFLCSLSALYLGSSIGLETLYNGMDACCTTFLMTGASLHITLHSLENSLFKASLFGALTTYSVDQATIRVVQRNH